MCQTLPFLCDMSHIPDKYVEKENPPNFRRLQDRSAKKRILKIVLANAVYKYLPVNIYAFSLYLKDFS